MNATQKSLLLLHTDPYLPFSGGVEKTVLQRAKKLACILAFPNSDGQIQIYSDEFPHRPEKILIQDLKRKYSFSRLEIHHILGWRQSDLLSLLSLPHCEKNFFIHDYFSICPSINLIHGGNKQFCQLSASVKSCSSCFQSFYQQNHSNLLGHRQSIAELLNLCDEISAPSSVAGDLFKKAFPEFSARLQIDVPPLDFAIDLPSQTEASQLNNKIIFIGAFSNLKGAKIFRQAIPELEQLNLKPEVWGRSVPGQSPLSIPLRPYEDRQELRSRFLLEKPSLVVLPSITAETFSYTFHETVAFSRALPIVGPWGLPAEQVKAWGYGLVMKDSTKEALILAVKQALFDGQEMAKRRPLEWPKFEKKSFNENERIKLPLPQPLSFELTWRAPQFNKTNHLKYWLKRWL